MLRETTACNTDTVISANLFLFAVYLEMQNTEVLCVPAFKLVYALPKEVVTMQIEKVNEISDVINIWRLFIKQTTSSLLTRIVGLLQNCNSEIVWFPFALVGNRKDRGG